MPVTNKMVKSSVVSYDTAKNIANLLSKESRAAGRKWLKLFFARHPDVAKPR